MKLGSIFFMTLLLTGYQLGLGATSIADSEVPGLVGWSLILNEPLTIPGNSATVFMQNGQVIAEQQKDQYYANCRLEVNYPEEQSRTVQTDTFTIYRIERDQEDVLWQPRRYASNGIILASGATADKYITVLYLRSPRQTDVTRLTCEHWEDPTIFPQHLTLQQINNTLGKIFTLKPES